MNVRSKFRAVRKSGLLCLAFLVLVPLRQAGAAEQRPIVFAGDSNYPPYEFVENGTPTGASVDLVKALGETLERPAELRLMKWEEAQKSVLSGKSDVLTIFGKNKKREKLYDFSEPTFVVSFSLFVRSRALASFDINRLSGLSIGVTEGGWARSWLKDEHPEANAVIIDNFEDGFRRLIRGDIDAVIANTWSGYLTLKWIGIASIKALPKKLKNVTAHMAVALGNRELLAEINKALAIVKATGKFDKIIDKWSGQEVVIYGRQQIWAYYALAIVGLIALGLLTGLLYLARSKRITLAHDITERKRAEEALRESRELEKQAHSLLIDAIESLPGAFTIYDAEDRFVLNNSKSMEMFPDHAPILKPGTSYEDVIRVSVEKGLIQVDPGEREVYIRRRLQEHKEKPDVIEQKWADGRWFEIYHRPTSDGGTVSLRLDVTQRKQTEETLRSTEQFLSVVFDTIPHDIIIKDREGRYLRVNKAWCDVFGLSQEEAFGKLPTELSTRPIEETLEIEREDRELIAANSTGERFEHAFHTKNGEVRHYRTTKAVIRDNQGAATGLVVVGDNVTESKKAEQELEANQRLLQTVFEAIPLGIQVKDREGRYLMVNQAMGSLYGYPPEKIPGMTFAELGIGTEEQRATVAEDDRKVVELGVRVQQLEAPLALSDGRIIWRNRFKVPLFDDTGVVVGVVGVIEDVTNRKLLEDQYQHAQKMEAIGTLASGIAHNFNNLLQMILMNLDLLQLKMNEDHPDYEIISSMQARVKDGAKLSNELLAYARERQSALGTVDLNRIVVKTANMFSQTRKNLEIVEGYADELWKVEADQSQLEQLLLNLYVNAGQAMANGGELLLQTENVMLDDEFVRPYELKSGRYVKFSMRDTGIGMSKETQERIFDPFFTTKEVGQGTGLGLSSVYGIIKNHKGIISVDSELDKGTTFCIYLPASEKDVDEVAQSSRGIRQGIGTILLVDDEEAATSTCRRILEYNGFRVLVANNGNQAVEIFQEMSEKVDLVILDWTMPGMSGGDVFVKLKELRPDVKVIVASGYGVEEVESEKLFQGMAGFIAKPFTMDELTEKIHEVLHSV